MTHSPVIVGYAGFGSGAVALPSPPSFAKTRVTVYDPRKGASYGLVLTHAGPEQGGYSFDLAFENRSDNPQTVFYSIDGIAA